MTAGTGSGDVVANPVTITNLAADQASAATNVAPGMVNAWGVASYRGMLWTAEAGSGKLAIVDGQGVPATGKLASESIMLDKGITGIAATDLASDDMTTFQLPVEPCAAAQLIVASAGGKLYGVNPDANATGGFVLIDRSADNASYTGVAVLPGTKPASGKQGTGPMILAADFHNGRIDVFDAKLMAVTNLAFTVPDAPAGFAPFNVAVIGDTIYVTYAKQDADREEEVAGKGLGFVAAFDRTGKLLGTVKGDLFNAPWGLAMAPGSFAPFPNALLVGNFGDGTITAVDPVQLTVLGQLTLASGSPAMVDGLWGLTFGDDATTNLHPDGLYFAAGPGDEMHGLFGVITGGPVTTQM